MKFLKFYEKNCLQNSLQGLDRVNKTGTISWELGAGSWELGAGSWELGAGSWELA